MKSHDTPAVEPFQRLSRMPDYTVERHQPDPRGWTVVNGRGHKVGEVKDLIVDTNRMTARYLDVELDTKLFDWRGDDPHVFVPVDRARAEGRHLVVPEITDSWAAELRTQRSMHTREFWDRWWNSGESGSGSGIATRVVRGVHPDDLQRVINDVRPGETVRIPVVNEEIVVQRLPAPEDEPHEHVVVNRAADEPPMRRR
jgi:hypothetical protein